ncbi:MAG: lysophospholipid acyltransferase family protein [Vulcanimicrobiota bacterium]
MRLNSFRPGVSPYHGPADGLSRPRRFPLATRAALTAGTACFCRVETEGLENLPRSGGHVYAPNHVSVLDVPILLNLPVDDMRTMVNVDLFGSRPVARGLTLAGIFPVDRVEPSPVTKEHTVDIVRSGSGLGIFPEGEFYPEGERGGIGPFKKGPAAAAILGKAETVVPIAIDYQPNDKPRLGERLLGLGAAAVVLAGSLACPTLGAVVGGVALGARLARRGVENPEPSNPTPRFVAGVKGGLAGAAIGALVGASSSGWAGLGCALAGAAGTVALAEAWRNRPVAHVRIGQPIEVAPYVAQAETDRKGAVLALTEKMHESIGGLRACLTGVPYDASAPKVTSSRPTIHWQPGVTLDELRGSRR